MDPDFTALASRVAARAEVLGCVILSRDGLVLGSFPPHGEQDITPGLLRFAALGDPVRGFAQFADELWAYVRQGAYAAFAVAEHTTRPGILLDYLEQALLVAEEARQFGVAMSEPVHVDLSKKGIGLGRRLRATTSIAEEDFRAAVTAPEREASTGPDRGDTNEGLPEAEAIPALPALDDTTLDEALAAALGAEEGGDQEPDDGDPPRAFEIEHLDDVPAAPAAGEGPGAVDQPEPGWRTSEIVAAAPDETGWQAPDETEWQAPDDPDSGHEEPPPGDRPAPPVSPDEIDRVALAREFAQLLQEGPVSAEGGQ